MRAVVAGAELLMLYVQAMQMDSGERPPTVANCRRVSHFGRAGREV